MKSIVIVAAIALVAVGCDRADATSRPNNLHVSDPGQSPIQVPADNTKRNETDRTPGALTPGDQGESDADIGITQRVRQGIIKDGSMSMSAKNVKVITTGGVVTLRGPVDSQHEKDAIASLAQHVDGVKQVDNQLEVKTK